MNKEKTRDLFYISLFIVVATFVILFFELGYLLTAFIYIGIPSIYISFKRKAFLKKTLLFSLMLSIPVVFVLDYIMHVSNVWYEFSTIGIRVLNSFPVDTFIWAFLYTFFIISFYEYFFDNDKMRNKFSRDIKYMIINLVTIVVVFLAVYFINKNLLVINHFYIIMIFVLFITPCVFVLYKFPGLIKKVFLQGAYFFVLSFIYELVAVKLGHWTFPGRYYIGWIELFGLRFPVEELLWLVLAVPAFICIYEYYADDRK